MLRLLAVFLPLFISFLFEACSKQGSALLPGEIIVNASELPGPIQEWKTDLACERCLTINLDNPSLPWFRISEGISEAYAHGVNNLPVGGSPKTELYSSCNLSYVLATSKEVFIRYCGIY